MAYLKKIWVEIVAVSKTGKQLVLKQEIPGNWPLGKIVKASGILEQLPEFKEQALSLGVFGKHRSLDDLVEAEDRIEVYRPLNQDPKRARALRVQKTRVMSASLECLANDRV